MARKPPYFMNVYEDDERRHWYQRDLYTSRDKADESASSYAPFVRRSYVLRIYPKKIGAREACEARALE